MNLSYIFFQFSSIYTSIFPTVNLISHQSCQLAFKVRQMQSTQLIAFSIFKFEGAIVHSEIEINLETMQKTLNTTPKAGTRVAKRNIRAQAQATTTGLNTKRSEQVRNFDI